MGQDSTFACWRCAAIVAATYSLFLGGIGTAQAQSIAAVTAPQTAHLIEWDLPAGADANSGALVVDTRGEDHNRLWFVTRVGFQRVYRFDLPKSLSRGNAQWTSWDLSADLSLFAGGILKIKPSHDRNFIFVHLSNVPPTGPDAPGTPDIQQIDTRCTPTTKNSTPSPCQQARIVWRFEDDLFTGFVSDLAVDDSNHVFSTGSNNSLFPGGYVQMLDPGQVNASSPKVKRWGFVTGALSGAGQCFTVTTGGNPCNAGIDVHPSKQYLVYFTEQLDAVDAQGKPVPGPFITELNTAANADPNSPSPGTNVRRWSLSALAAASCAANQGCEPIVQPRTLKIDRSGKVWINTGSGHLVSLDPDRSVMTKHVVPGLPASSPPVASSDNDLWGIAPDDDVIGYTASATSKVAMLFPKFKPIPVLFTRGFAAVSDFPVTPVREDEIPDSGTAQGIPKIATATTSPNPDGTYVEALINTAVPACSSAPSTPSLVPLGITPNNDKAQGTFFYTVGLEVGANSDAKRVGHARLPIKEKIKRPRDDDDADDGFDTAQCPAFHNAEPGDFDADGVPDQFDTPSSRDSMTMGDPAPLTAGQSVDYPLTASATSLALIASATADSPTAQIAVEIYNSVGALVATSAPMPGGAVATLLTPAAGQYTARVRNLGVASFNHTPTLVVREPAVP
jgi:hypothetical protein